MIQKFKSRHAPPRRFANYLTEEEEDMILMDYSCSGASLGCGTRFALFPGYISPSARGATRVPGRGHEEAEELAPVGPDSREITTLSIQPSTNFVRAPDSMRVFGLLHKLHRGAAPQKIRVCGGALLTPLFFLEQSAWS
jgi:hypothetical protein